MYTLRNKRDNDGNYSISEKCQRKRMKGIHYPKIVWNHSNFGLEEFFEIFNSFKCIVKGKRLYSKLFNCPDPFIFAFVEVKRRKKRRRGHFWFKAKIVLICFNIVFEFVVPSFARVWNFPNDTEYVKIFEMGWQGLEFVYKSAIRNDYFIDPRL